MWGNMKQKTSQLFAALAATVLTLPGFALAQAPAPTPITINVPQLNEKEFQLWVVKGNAYVELLNASTRAIDSVRRYASWVDMKVGPTGNERYISYGLYSVEPTAAARVVAKAREAASGPPPIPPLDEAARAYAASFEALVPLLNDAASYYERKDYTDDKMAGGKALHAKLVPAANAFFASRAQLQAGQEQLSDGLARQELALIEAREGRSKHWHIRRLAMAAKATLHAMPHDKNATDMTALSQNIAALAEAVRDYDEASKTFGGDDASSARELLA